jgi:hypothetical protein
MEFQPYLYNGKRYFNIFEIRDNGENLNEPFFRGSYYKDKRSYWIKKKVPSSVLIRVYKNEISNFSRAAYFVEEKFIEANCYATNNESPDVNVESSVSTVEKHPFRYPVLPIPPMIQLTDDDIGFQSDEGFTLNIEMRGERQSDRIFFKAIDVQKYMDLPRVYPTMTYDHTSFVYKDDFVFFAKPNANKKDIGYNNVVTKQANANKKDPAVVNHYTKQANANKKDPAVNNVDTKQANACRGGSRSDHELYLTFDGLVALLYRSKGGGYARRWTSWASKILFTTTFGTCEQRLEQAANDLRQPVKQLRDLIANSNKAVVYLIRIGSVKTIREFNERHLETMNTNCKTGKQLVPIDVSTLKDDQIVYKFGKTNDMYRRYDEHIKSYGLWSPQEFAYQKIAFVDDDEKRLTNAEQILREEFDKMGIRHVVEGHRELIVFDEAQTSSVHNVYRMMADEDNTTIRLQREQLKHLLDKFTTHERMHAIEIEKMQLKNDNLQIVVDHKEEMLAKEREMHAIQVELFKMKLANRE